MAEDWSSWGDTGPIIGVSVKTKDNGDSITANFSFMYCRRYNYHFSASYETTATAYIDDSYYNQKKFCPYSGDYEVDEEYDLITGTKTFNKSSLDYTVSFEFKCTAWGQVEWNKINGDKTAACQSAKVTITIPKDSSINAPTISTSYSIRKPDNNTFTISWNSVENASDYYVTLSDSSGRYSDSNTVKTTSKTFTVSNLANYRGCDFIATVRANGSDGYADSSPVSKTIATINSPPDRPSVTNQSGSSLTTQKSITFTVTAGSDIDGQKLSLYFSLDGGETKDEFTSPLEITDTTEEGGGITSKSDKIWFYTWDGLEFSNAATRTFTTTLAPVIGPVDMIHTPVPDINNDNSLLASGGKISFNMTSGTAKTVKLYVRFNELATSLTGDGISVSEKMYTYNESSETIDIPNICAISDIPSGFYYQFAFEVSDGSALSERTDWQSVKRKPYAPKIPTYRGYNNYWKSSDVAFSNYYMKNVALEFYGLTLSSGYARMKSISIIASYGNSSREYNFGTSVNDEGKYYLKMDLTQVNANVKTTFKIKVVDEANQVSEQAISGLELIKSSELTFAGNTVEINPKDLKPLSNSSPFRITHPIARASGTKVVTYTYKITVGSRSRTLVTSEYGIDKEFSTEVLIAIKITADKINEIVKNLATSTNDIFNSSVTVTAEDGFKETEAKTLSSIIFKANFSEAPQFINPSLDFRIKHEYYTNPPSLSTTSGTEVTGSSGLNVRMVNSGEGIIFMLPKATDLNGDNDIKEYQIDICRGDYTGQVNPTIGMFYSLIKIPYKALQNGIQDANYFYYRYTASTYSKTEYFYFQVYVIDQAGNISSKKKTSTYIIGSRTVSPVFSVDNIEVTRNDNQVTLNYKFKITDLGGNAKKTGWDKYFYNKYPNFEREINGYSPQALLIVEIAPDQNFKDNVVTRQINFSPSGTQKLYDFTSDEIELNGFNKSHVKIFIRFTLQVSHGLKNANKEVAIVSNQQVFTYFGAIPTVAHRKHKVGINTTVLDDDDVLVIENYQGTKYIVLKGTDKYNAANSYEIRIDLLQGKISGKKTQGDYSEDYLIIDGATIDGGSWDKI